MKPEKSSAPAVKPQGQWHHGNLRESLVQWGVALLREVSLDQLSLRQIAKSAGVSVGAPAHHFGDKDGLLAAMAAQGFRELIALRRSYLAKLPADDQQGRMHALVRGYVEFAQANGSLFELMLGPGLGNRLQYPELAEQGRASYLLFCEIAQPLLPPPDQCAMPHADALQMLWSSIHGLAILRVHRRPAPMKASRSRTLDHQVETMTQFCLAAIAGLRTP
ncbi:MAG: TetR/AcrR family transcriptional regulator [Comamonas sp.]